MKNDFMIFLDIINDYIAVECITLNQFSKLVNVEQATVSKWTCLKLYPSVSSVIKVADFLGCSMDYLLGLSQDKTIIKGEQKSEFIDRFLFLINERKVTQYRVAHECNIGDSATSKWKKGNLPKTETLIRLAKYLGCSTDYLMGRSDIM